MHLISYPINRVNAKLKHISEFLYEKNMNTIIGDVLFFIHFFPYKLTLEMRKGNIVHFIALHN